MTNAFRHGKATEININFFKDKDNIKLSIRDNGKGSDKIIEGIGLKGMRERIENLNGTFKAEVLSDFGFSLNVMIPLLTK